MPPLPNTYDEDTKSLIASVQRRQEDLSQFQIPRLRNCEGPLTLQQNLAAELREGIDTLARQIEELDLLVGDLKGERNRRELKSVIDEFSQGLASLKKDARAALLASKRAIDSHSVSRREELLRSSVLKEKRNSNEKFGDDALMKASDDVIDALRRTTGLMQNELERSVLTVQMLESSTTTLRSTSTTHDMLISVMGTSKQLITALEKSDWIDRLLIITALVFFFLVVLFILKQRIVDRSLRIALWWTRFLPSGDLDFDRMKDEGVMSTVSMVATSITASASSALAGLLHSGSDAFESPSSAVDTTLPPSLSSVISHTTDAPWTTDTVDSNLGVHDEL